MAQTTTIHPYLYLRMVLQSSLAILTSTPSALMVLQTAPVIKCPWFAYQKLPCQGHIVFLVSVEIVSAVSAVEAVWSSAPRLQYRSVVQSKKLGTFQLAT